MCSLKEHVLPAASIGFARCRRQAPGLGTTDTKLPLLVLRSGAAAGVVRVHARAPNLRLRPLGRGYRGTPQDAPALTGLPSHSDRAQGPRNATSHRAQRGYTADTPAWSWAVHCGVDCQSVRAAKTASLCLVRTTSRHVSRPLRDRGRRSSPIIVRPYKNPTNLVFHWRCLAEFS